MSSGSYYASFNVRNDSNCDREFYNTMDSRSYSTSSSTQRATPSFPSNNNHSFSVLYPTNGSLVPITPMSHTPHGIIQAPPQPDPSRRHRCPDCLKCFDRPSSLSTHMVTHTKACLFPCTECNKSFNVKSNRNRHMREQHGIHDPEGSTYSRRSTTRYPSSASSEVPAQGSYYSSSSKRT